MHLCDFCAKNCKDCLKTDQKEIKNDGAIIEISDYLKIFNFDDMNCFKKPNLICVRCLIKLQNCYNFVEQIKTAQNRLQKLLPTHNAKQNCRNIADNTKFRRILPRPADIVDHKQIPTEKASKRTRAYKCNDCQDVFNSFRQLKQHELTHKSNGSNICEYCCSLFASALEMEQHQKQVHGNSNFLCLSCKLEYKTKGHLYKHVQKVHHNDSLIYYCTICAGTELSTFLTRQALEEHNSIAHLAKFIAEAPAESAQAEDDIDLEMHAEFLDEFLLENSLHFSECWDALDLHLPEETQTDLTSAFNCPNCMEAFVSQKLLLRHLAEKHDLPLLVCNKCEASFCSIEKLTQHKAKHMDKACAESVGTQCGICDKTFKSNAAFNYHIKIHSRTGIQCHHACPYCGKQFHAANNLKQHLRIVHTQLKRKSCQFCDKTFTTLDHLKKHLRSAHQTERKHICEFCEKGFTQLCHLKEHMTVHTGNGKNFKCTFCGATFWKKIILERHISKKHS